MREDGTLKGTKKRVTKKECKRPREEFEVGGVMAQIVLWNIAQKECWKIEELRQKRLRLAP